MRKLILATQNPKKRAELEALADGYEVLLLDDVGLADIVIDENGQTFEDNARIKAEAVFRALSVEQRNDPLLVAILADDSGLCVDALQGQPGVRSARFAEDHQEGSGDDDNNSLLLKKLAHCHDGARSARFVCSICVWPTRAEAFFAEGTVEGTIAQDLKGDGGFGYDPLFCPNDYPQRRMAELSAAEKHAISHRGHAMRAALAQLRRC